MSAAPAVGRGVCHTIVVRVAGPQLHLRGGGVAAVDACPVCGLVHAQLADVVGFEGAEVVEVHGDALSQGWSEVAASEDACDPFAMSTTAPLQLCATPQRAAAGGDGGAAGVGGSSPRQKSKSRKRASKQSVDIHLKVVANPMELAKRARFSIYPPWRLGPDVRFTWRLGPSGSGGGNVGDESQLRCKPRPFAVQADVLGPEAETPQSFRLPLHQHQLRSLAWMLSCESKSRQPLLLGAGREFLPVLSPPHDFQVALGAAAGLKAIARVQRAYAVRGGLLADRVGSGKTATMLALMEKAHESAEAQAPLARVGGRRTLVLAPSRLLPQWRGEVSKFLGDEAWKVVLLLSADELGAPEAEAEALANVDLVLVPFELVAAPSSYGSGSMDQGRRAKRSRVGSDEMQGSSRLMSVLEVVPFARVVVDEFHEAFLPQWGSVRTALQRLSFESIWGLSGTPPLGDFKAVAAMANVFGVDLDLFSHQLDSHELAQATLNHLSCMNTSAELEGLRIREEIQPLHQTPAEKAIYMQLYMSSCSAVEHGQSGREVEVALLQLCSHFQLDGSDANWEDAETACAKALRERQGAVETAREWLQAAASRMEVCVLGQRLQGPVPDLILEQYEQLLAEIGFSDSSPEASLAEASGVKAAIDEQVSGARAARAGSSGHRHESEADGIIRASILSARAAAPQHVGDGGPRGEATFEMLEEVRQAKEAFKQRRHEHAFLDTTLRAASAEDFACPICFARPEPSGRAVLASCAHLFCHGCAARLARNSRECALCRQALAGGSEVLRIIEPGALPSAERHNWRRWGRFGSKIFQVVRKLREIEQKDPTARSIVFVQWASLRAKLAAAFSEFGIGFLSLEMHHLDAAAPQDGVSGPSFWQRNDIIMSFQHAPRECTEGKKILLLSLQDAASGLNLTRANHVLFVHPMSASTQRAAVAYEMQALGRCVRLGQKKTVFLWRFVTMGTVEEQISLHHQKALWEKRPELWSAREHGSWEGAEAGLIPGSSGEACEEVDLDDLFW